MYFNWVTGKLNSSSIPADMLRLTQEPVREVQESSWTRTWFVERTFPSGAEEEQDFNGSFNFKISGNFESPNRIHVPEYDWYYIDSNDEYEEGHLYFQYDAPIITRPVDRLLIKNQKEMQTRVQEVKESQVGMQEQLDAVHEAVQKLLELFEEEELS